MLDSIGLTLPQAVGIAASPFPVIAVIIILMSPGAKRTGVLFMLGWVIGILAATTAFSFATRLAVGDATEAESQPFLALFKIALGALLILMAIRQWRKRPGPDTEPEMPSWMSRVDGMRPGAAFILALGLAVANPKNLIMAATAGSVIGASREVIGDSVWVIVIFTLVATISVTLPVLAATVAPKASASALASTRTWLVANNATIMTVLFVILATQNIGAGISLF